MRSFTFLLLVFLCPGSTLNAQNIITITEDKEYDDTVLISEGTIIKGVGVPNVQCNRTPKFSVVGATLLVQNERIPVWSNWGSVTDGVIESYGIGVTGITSDLYTIEPARLDGSTKE